MPTNQKPSSLKSSQIFLLGKSINFNKRKIKAALLKLNDWFPWVTFSYYLRGKDRNLDSDWLAQGISTKMKCRPRWRVQVFRGNIEVRVYISRCTANCPFKSNSVHCNLNGILVHLITWISPPSESGLVFRCQLKTGPTMIQYLRNCSILDQKSTN